MHITLQNMIDSASNSSSRSRAKIAIMERNPYNTLVFFRASGWSDTELTDIVVKRAHTRSKIAIPKIPPYSSNGERDVVVKIFSTKNPTEQMHNSIKNSNFSSSFIVLLLFCLFYLCLELNDNVIFIKVKSSCLLAVGIFLYGIIIQKFLYLEK